MNTYTLAPYVRMGFQRDTLFCGFGSIQQPIHDPTQQQLTLAAAAAWTTPHTAERMEQYLITQHDATAEHAKSIVDFFLHGHYLMPEGEYDSADRYSRHQLYYNLSGGLPAEVQQLLAKAHVVILGAGGIGNAVAVTLAGAGVGQLTLVDSDHIEVSNLTRQILFTEADCGANKVHTLQKALQARNSTICVETCNMRITTPDDLNALPSADLLVVSADKPRALITWVNRHCQRTRTPFLNVGYVQDIAVWGPFVIPGKTGCWECQALTASPDVPNDHVVAQLRQINEQYQAPSVGPINMMAAAHASVDILKFLGQFGAIAAHNKRIGLWTDSLRIETQDCSRNPECPICRELV